MESLLIRCSVTPSFLPKFPGAFGLCSPSSGAQVCKLRNHVDKKTTEPLIWKSKNDSIMNTSRFVALSRSKSEKYLVMNAAAASVEYSSFESHPSKSLFETIQRQFEVFCRFSRLYVLIGTVLSIISVSFIAAERVSDISPVFLTGMFEAIVAIFFMHVYMTGLNQKVNKPYLPLASGEYSFKTGVIITLCSALMSLGLGWIVGSRPLFCALLVYFLPGTAYSIDVPLLRWKNSAFLAALCIFSARVTSYLAFYLHIQTFVLQRPAILPKPIIFGLTFISIISVVVSLAKDIPDVEGDKLHGVRSFAVQFGQEKVFWICIALLQIAYCVATSIGLTCSQNGSKFITVVSHLFLASLVWSRAKSVDLGSKTSIASFYRFIWKLLYVESFLVPFMR